MRGGDVPDVRGESWWIEVVLHEIVVAEDLSATSSKKLGRELQNIADVHHTRRMERVCDAETVQVDVYPNDDHRKQAPTREQRPGR